MPVSGGSGIAQLLATSEIVVTCGAGGVGKTTMAAALGTKAALELGGKVLVLTVDPARRLANALGLAELGNVETQVSAAAFAEVGLVPKGELWVAMADTKQSWDDLVRRHAPDPRTRDAILANPLYDNITGRFVQSHDYIAMERLYEIHRSGRYDLVVVDTPPSRNAIDFLDAPGRMADFFGSRLLRWLTVPYRSRVLNMASRPFYQVADRILGSQFLEDIAEFFILFQSMERGFVERARAVSQVLTDRRTAFMLVSTLEAVPAREAEFFLDALAERGLPVGALILNRVLPAMLLEPAGASAADTLRRDAGAIAAQLDAVASHDEVTRVLQEMAGTFDNFHMAARREAEQRRRLEERATRSARKPVSLGARSVVAVPDVPAELTDVKGLSILGEWLWRETSDL